MTELNDMFSQINFKNAAPVLVMPMPWREFDFSEGWVFMEMDSAEHPVYPGGRDDNTQFNDYVAGNYCRTVTQENKSVEFAA